MFIIRCGLVMTACLINLWLLVGMELLQLPMYLRGINYWVSAFCVTEVIDCKFWIRADKINQASICYIAIRKQEAYRSSC